MKKLLLPFALLLTLASCSKSDFTSFEKVKVIQSGEYIEVYGFLEHVKSQPWIYIVDVKLCDTVKRFTVEIPAGELTGWIDGQDNCKVEGFKIVYDDIKRQ